MKRPFLGVLVEKADEWRMFRRRGEDRATAETVASASGWRGSHTLQPKAGRPVWFLVFGFLAAGSRSYAGDPAYQYVILNTPTQPALSGNSSEFIQAPKIHLAIPGGAQCDYALLWDNSALYGSAQCQDAYLDATATVQNGFSIFGDDSGIFFFDTGFDGWQGPPFSAPGAGDYTFAMNILNTRSETQGPGTNPWNSGAVSTVVLRGTVNADVNTDTGYGLEWKIPWASWGLIPPSAGVQWGVNIQLRDQRADSMFTLLKSWTNTPGDNVSDPYFTGLARFGLARQVLQLTWISAENSPLFFNSVNNPVGQLNCAVAGNDVLTGFTVVNLGTAAAGREISALKLWYRLGGGEFDARYSQWLGTFSPEDNQTWTLALHQDLRDGDALYLTADISPLSRLDSTCQFSLPVNGAGFESGVPREAMVLGNSLVQVIKRSSELLVIFEDNFPPVDVLQGSGQVELLHIVLDNQRGMDFILSSLRLTLFNRALELKSMDSVFSRLWLDKSGVTLSEASAPFSEAVFSLAPGELIRDGGQLTLRLFGSVQPGAQGQFCLGLKDNQAVNAGLVSIGSGAGKPFPLAGNPLNVRTPDLAEMIGNYPNPFRAGLETTRVAYPLKMAADVRLEIYSLSGEKIRTVFNGRQEAGMQGIPWDGRNSRGYKVKSGGYRIRLHVQYADGTTREQNWKAAVLP